jgi:NAD(P)-dependent dehydrogenase (short-subunit alcohol dehydrogenase family)
LGRTGEPDDIATAIRFLAGPESGWVTGQINSTDGGQEQANARDILDDMFGKETMDQIRAGRAPA